MPRSTEITKETPPSRDGEARETDELGSLELARGMDEGYRGEAEQPSLDPAWTNIETEGL